MSKSTKRAAAFAGVAAAGLYALYRYQPLRIELRPRTLPDRNPPQDPDSDRLFSKKASVLVVVAHPDDAEFYMGGTLTRLREHGARIGLVVTTDGDKGYYPNMDVERLRTIRRQEQIESAQAFGCESVTFLGYGDGRLRNTPVLVRQIRDAIRKFGADYVITFDPKYSPRLQHSDHLRTGEATHAAVRELGGPLWLLSFSTRAPNFAVDITDAWPDKRRLLAIHASQFHGRRLRFIERLVHGFAAEAGALADVPLAEAFRVQGQQRK